MNNIITAIVIKERFATLVWARHALANSIRVDLATWSSLISGPVLVTLRTLYTIPTARLDATADVSE